MSLKVPINGTGRIGIIVAAKDDTPTYVLNINKNDKRVSSDFVGSTYSSRLVDICIFVGNR